MLNYVPVTANTTLHTLVSIFKLKGDLRLVCQCKSMVSRESGCRQSSRSYRFRRPQRWLCSQPTSPIIYCMWRYLWRLGRRVRTYKNGIYFGGYGTIRQRNKTFLGVITRIVKFANAIRYIQWNEVRLNYAYYTGNLGTLNRPNNTKIDVSNIKLPAWCVTARSLGTI